MDVPFDGRASHFFHGYRLFDVYLGLITNQLQTYASAGVLPALVLRGRRLRPVKWAGVLLLSLFCTPVFVPGQNKRTAFFRHSEQPPRTECAGASPRNLSEQKNKKRAGRSFGCAGRAWGRANDDFFSKFSKNRVQRLKNRAVFRIIDLSFGSCERAREKTGAFLHRIRSSL